MLHKNLNTVAIVDDDPIFLEYLTALLESEAGIHAFKASNGTELFAIMDEHDLECIVLDYDLGDETGLALGQSVKEHFSDAPPMIMLTGQGSERTVTKAFRIGFSDYVSKRKLVPNELVLAIRAAERRRQEEKARNEEIARLRRNEHFDGLTGLHSVEYVRGRLDELCASNTGSEFALIVLSLGSAATVRRELGHSVADRLIGSFAKQLMQASRGSALSGHLGTETFVCVYEGRNCDAAALAACERFASALSFETQFENAKVKAESEIGVARFPQDGGSPQQLIDAALAVLKVAASEKRTFGSTFEANRLGAAGAEEAGSDAVRKLAEKRKEPRRRVLKKGKIVIDGLNASVDCAVRNVSNSGAMLRVGSFFAVPNRFRLMIVGEGSPRMVEKRWQTGLDLGVEYQDAAQ